MLEMADKPQNASSLQENNTRFFSNILTSVIILIGIHVVVTLTVIYVGERQTTEELRKELKDLKSQIACANLVCGGEKYNLSYNYFDEIAQSYCTAANKFWVFAVRRDCRGVAPTCNDICNTATKDILTRIGHQHTRVACYDAFHIQQSHPVLRANPGPSQPDAGVVNMGTYGYGAGDCTWTPNHCGPNYCCCKAY